jgi:hypothetical protein
MPFFADKLDPNRPKEKRTADQVRKWMTGKLGEFRNANSKVRNIMIDNKEFLKTSMRPGFMYLYMYNPKYKKELPFYDRYPLVFPFQAVEGGFMGLNLHYLPPIMRAKLMDALYDKLSNQRYDETTRLKISYDILNSASRYKFFRPCIKRYLYSHLQTKFLLIPANEWDYALFIPFEQFEKNGSRINKEIVYRDSRNKINGV